MLCCCGIPDHLLLDDVVVVVPVEPIKTYKKGGRYHSTATVIRRQNCSFLVAVLTQNILLYMIKERFSL
jgi:hypothetical protein